MAKKQVIQSGKIDFDIQIRTPKNWTPKQEELIKIALNNKTKAIFIKGPAGVSKTYVAVYCALELLRSKKISDLILIRSAVESGDSKLGFLPGTLDEKIGAYMIPFQDKFEELLSESTIKALIKHDAVKNIPVNYIRGNHWAAKAIIVDEAQNLVKKEFLTILTRAGEFSKIFILGDPTQSDLPSSKDGAFNEMWDLFSDEESKKAGVHTFEFDEADIIRSEFVKFILEKFKQKK